MNNLNYGTGRDRRAFTLIEVLVSSALVVAIMVLMLGVIDQVQRINQRSQSKTSQFQSARNAFESMARRMSQATLNAYWRAQEITLGAERADFLFRRQSELQFASGPTARLLNASPAIATANSPIEENYPGHSVFFTAPIGYTEYIQGGVAPYRRLDSMLSAIGYFVEFGDDVEKPRFIADEKTLFPARNRYRLMEMLVPSERFNIYSRPSDSKLRADPRIFDERGQYYEAMVDVARRPNASWVRPLWMKEALTRIEDKYGRRFQYTHSLAENVIALIILPKVPEKDRLDYTVTPPRPDPTALELAPFYQFDSWRVLSGKTETDPIVTSVKLDNRIRDNLLPPIVQLTMIAIDEPSALRMNLGMSGKPKWLDDLFQTARKEEDYRDDIKRFEDRVRNDVNYKNVTYRIFTTDVIIRGSKWSRDPSY